MINYTESSRKQMLEYEMWDIRDTNGYSRYFQFR